MARKLRVQYPGAVYHVLNRGDRRERIYCDDHDRQRFLDTLGEACANTEWQVHAYCLMRNHFHLVIETPQPNLVAGMKWLLGVYTKRFNIRHKYCADTFLPGGTRRWWSMAAGTATCVRCATTFTSIRCGPN